MGYPLYFNSNTFCITFSPLVPDNTNDITLINHIFPCYGKIVIFFNKYIFVISENVKIFKGIFSSGLPEKWTKVSWTYILSPNPEFRVHICMYFLWHCQNLLQDGIRSENKTHSPGFSILLQRSHVVIAGRIVQVRVASVDMKRDVWAWLIAHLNRQHNNDYVFGAWCSYDLFNCLT